MTTRLYVYAVCPGTPESTEAVDAVLAGVTGVAGGPVTTIGVEGLLAVVGEVPAEEFSEDRLEQRMQDLPWLATTARAHHAVVDELGRRTAVAPLSLATVFLDGDRVRAALAERRDRLTAVLDRVRGRAEWGVKAFRPAGPPPGARAARDRPSSGAEYLRRRRAEVDATRNRDDDAERSATALFDAVAAVSAGARRHPLHDASLTGREEPMVLNAAYLVPEDDAGTWCDAVEQAAPDTLLVEITGPWVPYSFTEAPDPVDGMAGP
ncbi:GvpL/GvpF family gas vesicle protein [Pseudonocardia phyllosphaerae]|uniref:GvpL/GvpF family gas vesicle protein n=1 Tax=Pseudonocardia phyllosphaerae TaxID=3390502 RepID=UPI00397E86D9